MTTCNSLPLSPCLLVSRFRGSRFSVLGSTMTHVTCHILDTGYCLAHESLVMRGGARREIACHSLVALIHHPRHGWGLWDTGYAPRMLEATARWPFSLY